jgi:hypothetical protein
MRLDRDAEVAAFLEAAGPWLAADEVANSVMLTIASSLANGTRTSRQPPYVTEGTSGGAKRPTARRRSVCRASNSRPNDGQSWIRFRRRQLLARIANEEGREQGRSPINSREAEMNAAATPQGKAPWNKGKLVGQKAPLKLKDVWATRIRLQIEKRIRVCLTWGSTASSGHVIWWPPRDSAETY